MKVVSSIRCAIRYLGWLLLAVLLVRADTAAAAIEQTFEVLNIGTQTYKNVTVLTKRPEYVFISYAGGMTSLKVASLPDDVRRQLGYSAANEKTGFFASLTSLRNNAGSTTDTASNTNDTAATESSTTVKTGLAGRLSAIQDAPQVAQLKQLWEKQSSVAISELTLNPRTLYLTLGAVAFLYLFFCYCCSLICEKTGNPPGILIWIPVLQMFPLLRAASMSPLWFFAFLIPVLNVIAPIVWCVRISKARGKSPWLALPLLLPGISLLAFLYLAFSSGPASARKLHLGAPLVLETA
jgi:hypothetical protein